MSIRVILTVFAFAALYPSEGKCMGIGNGFRLVLFSEVNGQVVNKGKPVIGAEVERSYRWSWNKRKGTDRTRTDKDGNFHFNKVVTSSITAQWLPHQPVITQKIEIRVGNTTYEAWEMMKMNYDHNGELDGQPLNFLCDIATKPDFKGEFYGISRIR